MRATSWRRREGNGSGSSECSSIGEDAHTLRRECRRAVRRMSQKCRRVRGTFALQGSTVDRWWRLDCHVRPADPEDGTKAIPPKADAAEAKSAAAASTSTDANPTADRG